MTVALLVVCSMLVGLPAEPAGSNSPNSAVFTTENIDRAVKRVDVREERAQHLALHPDSPLPGILPSYAAVILVEDKVDRLKPKIEEYHTWPGFGVGGRQGPAYDKWTGIPWWF